MVIGAGAIVALAATPVVSVVAAEAPTATPMDRLNKGLFAFASYNAGPAKIQSAEKIGQETVTYVANIYKYYAAYTLLIEASDEKRQARQEVEKGRTR